MEKLSTSSPSPLSPTRWPADAFAWPRSFFAIVAIFIAFGAGVLLDSFVAVALGVTQNDVRFEHLRWGILVGQLAAYVPPLLAILILLPWVGRRSLAQFGLRPLDARDLGIALIGTVAMYGVTLAVANVQFAFTHEKPEEASISLFTSAHDPALAIAFAVLAVAIAPVFEELLFRGVIFNALLRYLPVGAAATISGIVFGAFHLSWSAFVPLASSGIVLAFVYYRSGSLVASMLTHALFNAINVGLLELGKS